MPEKLFESKLAIERREFVRVPMRMAVHFKSLSRGDISCLMKSKSEDFSAGGLAMPATQKMRRGQLLMLNLFLPIQTKLKMVPEPMDFTRLACQPAAVLSRVAYCTQESDAYRLGVQFLDLDKDNRKLFKTFLVKCQLLKPNSKLYA